MGLTVCDVGCGGWFAGIEAVLVKPHVGDGVLVDDTAVAPVMLLVIERESSS